MTTKVIGAAFLALASAAFVTLAAPAAVPDVPSGIDSSASREFSEHVEQYLKMRKAMTHVKVTRKREDINQQRQELAQQIGEARNNAKPGDVFTPAVAQEFRRLIRSTLQGKNAPRVRQTIREGAPVTGRALTVNSAYPDALPVTTVPPTLLRHLPQLPAQLAYRIVGHDFVLQDTEARLVVDFIPGVLP